MSDTLNAEGSRRDSSMQPKKVKKKSSRAVDLSATDYKSDTRQANSSMGKGGSTRDRNELVGRRVSNHESAE